MTGGTRYVCSAAILGDLCGVIGIDAKSDTTHTGQRLPANHNVRTLDR
jgi:hypothetical protein